ncbi:carboxypeptidase regulatory-like domain-containing protein, partial [candidate division WOR-3 bacterium]|nr:carboxypeptidase regulatory-like domain-containing protein [candidate division WOR-3 bacterium]
MTKKLLILVVCVAVVAALVPSYVGATSTSGGIDYFDGVHWWGFRVYFSDATCDEIAHQLIIGGGATTVTGIILAKFGPYGGIPGVITLVVGVLMGMTGAEMNYTNKDNTGIVMRFNFTFIPFPPLLITGMWPQSCGVYGLVENHATGDPLSSATVTAKQSGQVVQEVETNAWGWYVINLEPGVYMVTVSHTGFYDLTTPVSVSDGGGAYTTLNFQLYQNTGGGGCPYLQVWDSSDYVDEGLL